jgi:hypothetical protein
VINFNKFKGIHTALQASKISKKFNRVVAFAVNSRGPGGEDYYKAGKCMVAHINKFSKNCFDKIIIFDLGLDPDHRKELSEMNNVMLFDFPDETKQFYSDYFRPKHYAWKYAVTWYASLLAETVLYIDAGKFPTCSLERAFEVIEQDGFLLATPAKSYVSGESFRKEWLNIPLGIGNKTFYITSVYQEIFNITPEEARYPMCFAAIVGFSCASEYYKTVIEQAFKWTRDPRVCSHGFDPKRNHLQEQSLITLLAKRAGYNQLHMEVVRSNFGPGYPDQKRFITRFGEDILIFWRAHGEEVNYLLRQFSNE